MTWRSRVLLIDDNVADADRFEAILEEAAPAAFDIVRAPTLDASSALLEGGLLECAVIATGFAGGNRRGLADVEAFVDRWPTVALVVLTNVEDDELGGVIVEAGADDYLAKSGRDGRLIDHSLRHAIVRKRFETSFAEAQSIARVGSWEVEIATSRMTWSRELYRLLGFPQGLEPSYELLIERAHPDDRGSVLQAHHAAMTDFAPFVLEHRVVLPGEVVRWVRAQGRIELDANGRPARLLGATQDITERKEGENALQHQALHDPLTGLPNRLLLLDRLGHALNRLARQPSSVAVIYFDIDRFQLVNESLGHLIGDQVLVAMAERLVDLVRPEDTLAHLGGDEFVVLCEGLLGEEEAVSIADRINAILATPLSWSDGELVVSVSAGIALTTSGSANPDMLLRDADAAMYRAKSEGRARSVVYAESMHASVVGRLDTEMSLRRSIVNGDLRLHYQPIVSIDDGAIQGHEALVRWAHPTRGLLTPDQFITIAEDTGLIVDLGEWVLREACQQAKQFQERDPRWAHLTMSVNLSGGQLRQRGLVDLVDSALNDANFRPEDLQLEMTESVLMDDAAATISILEILKELGILLGIDDFGTGYSSLAYLQRFPVDVLKIDQSFVSGLGHNDQSSAIVAAVVSMAEALDLTTIAEGVETEEQRDCLIALGCKRAQGYLFARPVAADAIEASLDALVAAQ